MDYESRSLREAREERRAKLSAAARDCLELLAGRTVPERLAWYLEHRGGFFFEREDSGRRVALINSLVPSRKDEITAAADRLLRHEFDILGSGPVALGDPIDWQRDFKSGTRWRNDVVYPAWNWRKVDDLAGEEIFAGHFYSIDDASDLKVPWDLSSFFHLPVLAEAFLQTGDARYSAEVTCQLRHWHAENPYPRGVNWTCAMVAGIRLANLAFVLRLLDPADFIGETGVESIVRHVKFILDFLEVDHDGRRNNHYLNNLVGLGFGGAELARSELGRDLLDFVLDELSRELMTQFSEDGTNYEGSIPYHRFAAESAFLTAILLERNGRPMPDGVRAQMGRILRFLDVYTKPNGLAPQVGDNDNGRILVLHGYAGQEYRDHRHILAVGASWLRAGELTSDVTGQCADVAWLLGRSARELPAARNVALVAGLYTRNGYAAAKNGRSSLLIRCGRINAMSGGGHNHCDQLSFEYHDRMEDVIVDPGALIYSGNADLRNRLRATAAHNAVQMEDLEQQEFSPRDLFSMEDRAGAVANTWEVEGAIVFFSGEHRVRGWRIAREIRWDACQGVLRICDTVEPPGPDAGARRFRGRFHLAAGIACERRDDFTFLLSRGATRWIVRFDADVAADRVDGLVSPSYGVALPASVLEYGFEAGGSRRVTAVVEREPA